MSIPAFLALAACALLSTAAVAAPRFDGHPSPVLSIPQPDLKVLQAFGAGAATLSAAVSVPAAATLEGVTLLGLNELIATGVRITTSRTRTGFNVSCALEADGHLGYTSFRLRARTRLRGVLSETALPCSLDVLGVQLTRSGKPLGGDGRPPLMFSRYMRSASFLGKVYAGRNRPAASLSDCKTRIVETGARKPTYLPASGVKIRGNLCTLTPVQGKTTKGVRIGFECPGISIDGETAETDVDVRAAP